MGNDFEDRLLTVAEAARFLGLAEGTIRNKISRSEIPYVKLGGATRLRLSELERWIIEQTAEAEERREAGKAEAADRAAA